jgi:hypothetical protein
VDSFLDVLKVLVALIAVLAPIVTLYRHSPLGNGLPKTADSVLAWLTGDAFRGLVDAVTEAAVSGTVRRDNGIRYLLRITTGTRWELSEPEAANAVDFVMAEVEAGKDFMRLTKELVGRK